MNSSDLISVVMPIYNVEKYIKTAVNSVLAQSYKNFELICVNDGSTDKSGEICKNIALSDTRIIYVEKTNGGLSDARNYGIERAKGDYLVFIDSDDYYDVDYLLFLHEIITDSCADIAICNFNRVRNNSTSYRSKKINTKVLSGIEAFENIYCNDNMQPSVYYTVVWNKMFSKKIYKNLRFPKDKLYEDQYYTYKCFLNSSKVVATDLQLYQYRVRTGSITSKSTVKGMIDILEAHIEQLDYLNKNKIFINQSALNIFYKKLIALLIDFLNYSNLFFSGEEAKRLKCFIKKIMIRKILCYKIELKDKIIFIYNYILS